MKRWIHAAETITASEIVPNGHIQKGMFWDSDGHEQEVTFVSKDGKSCRIKENWISEDTGKPVSHVYKCKIVEDEDGEEFAYDPKYEEYALAPDWTYGFRWYATSAFNYPYASPKEIEPNEDGYYDDDDYTPSATNGDYSPSSPWNAPGMSVKDFI